jgi:hypothetical protein
MDEITDRVTVNIANVQFDRATQDITADVYVANTSSKTLKGPIMLRLTRVSSRVGVPSLVGSSNARADETADDIIDYTKQLHGNTLGPNERSLPSRLSFHIAQLPSNLAALPADALTHLVSFVARAYGPAEHKPAGSKS